MDTYDSQPLWLTATQIFIVKHLVDPTNPVPVYSSKHAASLPASVHHPNPWDVDH